MFDVIIFFKACDCVNVASIKGKLHCNSKISLVL